MKLTDFTLIFVMIFVCVSFTTDRTLELNGKVAIEQQNYNRAIDTALSDSMFMLVELDDGTDVKINIEKAMNVFLSSMCINLGINNSKDNKERLKEYIPVMLFVLKDEYVVIKHIYDKEDRFVIMEPVKYSYEDDKYKYYFHLDDTLTLYDGKDYVEGKIENIGYAYNDCLASNITEYEQKKNQVIIDMITDELKKCTEDEYLNCSKANWNFSIPYEEDDVWNRTIKDIGVIAIFSGYPYSDSSLGYYSKFAFGGARIWKKE